MKTRKLFVAGATGATGKVVVTLAHERGIKIAPQVRPKSAASAPKGAEIGSSV